MSEHTLQKPVVGISLGDINGIGPEIVIKALADDRLLDMLSPVVYGSAKVLSYYRKALRYNDFNYHQVNDNESIHHGKVNVVNCWQEMIEINMGQETPEGGRAALLALQKAAEHLQAGKIDGIVTAPINKNNIQSDAFRFPGHTEFFTETFGAKDSLMLLCSENLRVGVVTGHIPLKNVSEQLTAEKLRSKLLILEKTLHNDFGIGKPRIAVLGLNPHAGEGGLLGTEEQEVIIPTLRELKEKGKLIFGPFPADGFFGTGQYKKFDGILAMYHDQGLIPFKLMAFETGVNYTAGLSVVRTSPDHGTAYDICGQGVASEQSIREAIYMACDIIRRRKG